MDDRKLTLIVVPHGDLETRSYEIPYRRLRLAIILVGGVVLIAGAVLATWFPVFAQAARVPSLQRQLDELQEKQAEVVRLAEALEEVEAQYERVRALLGADAPSSGIPPTLPPLRRDSAAAGAPGAAEAEPQPAVQGASNGTSRARADFLVRAMSGSRSAPPAPAGTRAGGNEPTGSNGSPRVPTRPRPEADGHAGALGDPILLRQP